MQTGIGGTPGVPYEKDVQYWVGYLREHWIESVIPQEVIDQILAAPHMIAARQIAMDFHDSRLSQNECLSQAG